MNTWPQLDDLGWRETCSALHLYHQVAGKYRLAYSPWLNHRRGGTTLTALSSVREGADRPPSGMAGRRTAMMRAWQWKQQAGTLAERTLK
jgi:hypothetical protein